MQESLRLRMSLVGGMFDTIQRNSGLYQEWSMILIQLISHGVVRAFNSALFDCTAWKLGLKQGKIWRSVRMWIELEVLCDLAQGHLVQDH